MSIPHGFYNITILDEIHTLFPEFLYDSRLFPNDAFGPISWLRYRMTQMFPQTYRRGRLNYESMQQHNTRSDYEDWLFITGRQIQAPQQIRMQYNNDIFTTPPRNPIYSSPIISTPPSIQRTWGGEDALGILSLALRMPTESWLSGFLDAVPIMPTPQEIESASEILQNTVVPADTICTICQEHDMSPNEATVWRRLIGCSHFFHRTCIDRWFSRNSHCPVCRFDIRARRGQDQSSAQSSSESENFPM